MLASSLRRRFVAVFAISALVYSLVVALSTPKQGDAVVIGADPLKLDAGLMATTTAAPQWASRGAVDWPTAGWGVGFAPGESPELRIHVQNQALKERVGSGVSNEINFMRNSAARANQITITFEPGFSPDTDIELLSGTIFPNNTLMPRRGGRPGNPASNPTNLTGNPDGGTATARVCVSFFIANECTWVRAMPTGVNMSGCPGWNTVNNETGSGDIFGVVSGQGPAHIWALTNDVGPYPYQDGTSHPKGRLWDRRAQRWAWAKLSGLACARAVVSIVTVDQVMYLDVYLYKDTPVPGAVQMRLYQGFDTRLGGPPPPDYKSCGGSQQNPCIGLYGLAPVLHLFGNGRRVATTPKACGVFRGRVEFANDVTSPGHTYYSGSVNLPSNDYPNCPPALAGTVAHSSGRALQNAYVYAFDAATGQLVNAPPAAGATTASAAVPCRGGAIPNDPPTGPTGPAPGTAVSSYGCARIRGNTGNFPELSPGWGDPRWYIRTNTGSGTYKVLVSSPPGDGNVSRWAASTPPASGINSWVDAGTWSTSTGPNPTFVGDSGTVTTTLSTGNPISGSVTRNGGWATSDQGAVFVWNSTGSQFEATWTALTGNGTYNVDVRASSAKVRFQVADGAGNPDLVGWYSGGSTPAENFSTGAVVTPPASLVTTNFTSGANITGTLLLNGSPPSGSHRPVYVYRNSDGQLVYIASAVDGTGNYGARVPTATSAYKVYAPGDSTVQSKWYNNVDTWNSATLVSAPSSGINFNLPAGTVISGYVKTRGTGPDGLGDNVPLASVPVYVYNASTGAFVGWTATGASGTYSIVVPSGSYKVLTAGTAQREQLWWDGALSYAEATAVTSPATVNFSLRGADNITGLTTQGGTPAANTLVSAFTLEGRLANNVLSTSSAGTNYAIKVPTTTSSGYQYKLRFIPVTGQTRWYQNQTSFAAANPVNSPATGINQETPP